MQQVLQGLIVEHLNDAGEVGVEVTMKAARIRYRYQVGGEITE
ncbi:hypothetical protein CES85_3314 (plasmid) [Ochrobactrum quorumnocens]|uniref:Uncharacterized protein n=1 Tax=Ochrobactrum quorumnocens TaxID=271865 RepID=A0A248UPY9_9HYPH|nr:hypothetical protein CES85_3314 [[Ochrobactrum] quorumnocens]